jgi:hypothetical protein
MIQQRTANRTLVSRRGAAVAEAAILLSIISFLFVVPIDLARVFYYSLALKNCARNGAYYTSDYPGIYSFGSPSAAARLAPGRAYRFVVTAQPDRVRRPNRRNSNGVSRCRAENGAALISSRRPIQDSRAARFS